MRLFSHHDRLYLTGGARHGREGDHDDDSSATHANAKRGAGIFIPHFHKFFGLLALFNIVLYITPLYDWAVSHLGTQKLMWLSCVHVVLALSSFEFRVGRQRNGLYTIYKEMQLHTITFTLRSWSVMVGAWVFGVENILLRASYLLAWHLVADYITANYQPPSKETTIRRSVDGKSGYQHHGPVVHFALFVFSFSQLVGIFMMMIDTENAVRNAMFVMAPVQISAFLATLVRKGYFSSQVSFVTYFMSLMPIFVFHPWSALEIACVILIAVARFKLRISKYVIWVTVAVLFSWLSGDLEKVVPMDVVPFTVAAPSLPETLTSRGLPLSTMTSHAFSALAPSNLSVF